jgi:hypothetical protein
VIADSGNGAHLLYRIDLLNDKASEVLVKRVLYTLETRFGDEAVGIDQSVFNAGRIVKLWGTTARKGDNTPDRPHRISRLLTVPEPLEKVTLEQLEHLAALAPEDTTPASPGSGHGIEVADYLATHGLEVSKHSSLNTRERWELQSCPWDSSHKRSAFVLQFQAGAVAAGCLHNSCREKKWQDLRDEVEGPQWRESKRRQQTPTKQKAPKDAEGKQERSSPSGGAAVPLIEIGAKLPLFHDSGGIAYALRRLASRGTRAVCLTSAAFRSWLAGEYHRQSGGQKAAAAEAINTAIGVLTARALEKDCGEVHVRVAEHDGNIYLDLADELGRVVEISATGWRVQKSAPVRFRVERGMLPLPAPERGGALEALRALVNAPSDAEWRLIIGWLIAALRPGRPFPVLVLQGEQGSAKSTTGRFLRGLIDPARPPDRARPRNDQDLAIAARNSWVLAYDNLSGFPDWLSDGLCRLATGGGFATRKLYADDDEAIFDFCRPVMLNGIDELLTRPDLADRALRVTLPTIADEQRRTATAMLAGYEAARPRILGALCDAVSGAIRGLPAAEHRITSPPRMADFALWVSAAEDALSWPQGAFLAAYAQNRGELVSESLEDDPVASAVQALLADLDSWTGTASELLKRLAEISGIGERPPRNWPSGPRALSGRLRRASPLLRRIGIEWKPPEGQTGPSRDRRHTLLRKQPFTSFTPFTSPAQAAPNPAQPEENEGADTRGSPNGRERSANGREPEPFAESPSEANGPNGANGSLHTSGLQPRNLAAGGGKVIDMQQGDTEDEAEAEARWAREAASRSAAGYRGEAERLRSKGDLEGAAKFERWAAEEEKKIAASAVTGGPIQ